jgi:hypothetical protein
MRLPLFHWQSSDHVPPGKCPVLLYHGTGILASPIATLQGRKCSPIFGRWNVTEHMCQPISRLHDLMGCNESNVVLLRKYIACEGRSLSDLYRGTWSKAQWAFNLGPRQ